MEDDAALIDARAKAGASEDLQEADRAGMDRRTAAWRRHPAIRALIALTIGFVVCFYFAYQIHNALILPYVWAAIRGGFAERGHPVPGDNFLIQIRVALFGGLFVALALTGQGIHRWIAPGLYGETSASRPYRIVAPLLFVIGAIVAYFVAVPLAARSVLSRAQASSGDAAPISALFGASDYLWLATLLILAFGIAFQVIGLTLLGRAGHSRQR